LIIYLLGLKNIRMISIKAKKYLLEGL